MVEIEPTTRGFKQDHHGLFLCPVDATGLPLYLSHSMTRVSGLRQEYLVEVFKRVMFIFTSSQSIKLFSQFVRAQFNLNPAQVPYLRAQANIFHTNSFPQVFSLPRHKWPRSLMIVSLSTALMPRFIFANHGETSVTSKGSQSHEDSEASKLTSPTTSSAGIR
ncbi:uncharacterized protein FFB20_12723 [Fusarium fujikuroi]|uniref:Uncharacterized protein n=2 Tax=Fusarium fujikuroi TaxID=5127 RepID=S0DWG2_GIBF5|nr:uncharacterized protein FFUJ_03921 [Fusarium fujikuroi IMI 58289]KLO99113.1 uncharacterized protein Y057_5040 [Fusarium fujikuroi]KLP22573.1 uncharacterized protein LW94_9796 [Fusarium fujikuroi]QGI78327.1 hypothetical protein CEK25_005056 [Fusarium fujikuroi]CCT64823.1 uncharacterized protein FFUJ_03921 [Fusarium fujikuroi IMI 58289]SCN89668.1 uncharacterized protein FFM5_04759 [Fusarium fujikuroi]